MPADAVPTDAAASGDGAEAVTDPLLEACGSAPSAVCRWMFEQTDNSFLSIAADWVVQKPFTVLLIFIGAFIVNRLVKRAITRVAERIAEAPPSERLEKLRAKGPGPVSVPAGRGLQARPSPRQDHQQCDDQHHGVRGLDSGGADDAGRAGHQHRPR